MSICFTNTTESLTVAVDYVLGIAKYRSYVDGQVILRKILQIKMNDFTAWGYIPVAKFIIRENVESLAVTCILVLAIITREFFYEN